jgi:hypothetical protein
MPPKLKTISPPQKDAAFVEPMECLAVRIHERWLKIR